MAVQRYVLGRGTSKHNNGAHVLPTHGSSPPPRAEWYCADKNDQLLASTKAVWTLFHSFARLSPVCPLFRDLGLEEISKRGDSARIVIDQTGSQSATRGSSSRGNRVCAVVQFSSIQLIPSTAFKQSPTPSTSRHRTFV